VFNGKLLDYLKKMGTIVSSPTDSKAMASAADKSKREQL
jgi:hypothetical protein